MSLPTAISIVAAVVSIACAAYTLGRCEGKHGTPAAEAPEREATECEAKLRETTSFALERDQAASQCAQHLDMLERVEALKRGAQLGEVN